MSESSRHSIPVSAVFLSESDLERVLRRLEELGFSEKDITVAMSEQTRERYQAASHNETRTPQGALLGGLSGSLVGGVIGSLALIGTTFAAAPGLLIAGPLVGAAAGTAIGSYAGTFAGALIGAGLSEHEARHCETALEAGDHVMVAVFTSEEKREVVEAAFRENHALPRPEPLKMNRSEDGPDTPDY